MKLGEFINKRLEELHMTRSVLVNDFGLNWSTLSNINRGIPINESTKQKLALALQCSQGDIQACLAEAPDERRKGGSVMETKDKTEKMIKGKPFVAPEPELEEDDTGDYGFAVPERTETDTVAEVYMESKEDFKAELRNLFLQCAKNRCGGGTVANLLTDFGEKVLALLTEEK